MNILTKYQMKTVSQYSRGLASDSNMAIWICLDREGPYRMKDLIRIFRSNTKEMSRHLREMEKAELICSGMIGKTKWFGITEGSARFIEAVYSAILW